jgi:mRNA-degrading endonuclease toxin of MazEF toxin-antitoxin module
MIPKLGEVYMVDLGMAGKVRPVVIVSREDANTSNTRMMSVSITMQPRKKLSDCRLLINTQLQLGVSVPPRFLNRFNGFQRFLR